MIRVVEWMQLERLATVECKVSASGVCWADYVARQVAMTRDATVAREALPWGVGWEPESSEQRVA